MSQRQEDRLQLRVNGRSYDYAGSPAKRLSDVLRDDLGLTGTKVGCNAGDCGACTILIDGKQVCSCLTAVAQASGREVTTDNRHQELYEKYRGRPKPAGR